MYHDICDGAPSPSRSIGYVSASGEHGSALSMACSSCVSSLVFSLSSSSSSSWSCVFTVLVESTGLTRSVTPSSTSLTRPSPPPRPCPWSLSLTSLSDSSHFRTVAYTTFICLFQQLHHKYNSLHHIKQYIRKTVEKLRVRERKWPMLFTCKWNVGRRDTGLPNHWISCDHVTRVAMHDCVCLQL